MAGRLFPKYAVFDDFLVETLADAIRAYAIGLEEAFQPIALAEGPGGGYPAGRSLLVSDDGLGPHGPAFEQAIADRFGEFCAAAGVRPFPLSRLELQLCAFRHGDHFEAHIDTDRKEVSKSLESDRILTAVYYISSNTGFAGGELGLHPFGLDAPAELIAPRANRLIVFPSIALHEVLPVFGSRRFRNARLSVNCWMHRQRGAAA